VIVTRDLTFAIQRSNVTVATRN